MAGEGRKLRSLVETGRTILVPDAHDALVAKIAVAEGFEALYVGSFGVSNAKFGVADQSLLGVNQLIEQARLIAATVEVPVCLDMEEGGGNAVTTYRNVIQAEAAGVAAIQIEDHVPGKEYGRGGKLHPVSVAADKIRAAVDARRNRDTVIIGRTEAVYVGLSEEEAFDRAAAYVDAGADMVTVSLLPISSARKFVEGLGVPLANFVFGESTDELTAAGLGLAIYPGHSVVAEHDATRRWLRLLRTGGVSHSRDEFMASVAALKELVGGLDNSLLAEKYGII
jgi:2-methylisocitrate lyase-like PEP mutase family enzyme